MSNEEIQKQGANARSMGKSVFDNPFLKDDQVPRITGDIVEVWLLKHDAWELGWRAEDARRGAA